MTTIPSTKYTMMKPSSSMSVQKKLVWMMMIITISTITTTTVSAFITKNGGGSNGHNFLPDIFQKAFIPKHDLQHIQEYFINTVLDMDLDIATIPSTSTNKVSSNSHTKSSHLLTQRNDAPRLAIRNLVVGLNRNSEIESPKQKKDQTNTAGAMTVGYSQKSSIPAITLPKSITNIIPMPGKNGPHPMTSSGCGPIQIHENGYYISLDVGRQYLPIDTNENLDGSSSNNNNKHQWELIWKEHSPAGVLVCGIELHNTIRRNHATVPQGVMYISYPIWKTDTLQQYQVKQQNCDIASKNYLQERDDELYKMKETKNVVAKMIHYRNAFAAMEQYSLLPKKMLSTVPKNQNDIISIGPDLCISRSGTVRVVPSSMIASAKNNLFGFQFNLLGNQHPTDDGIVRGTATLRTPTKPNNTVEPTVLETPNMEMNP